LEGNVWDVELWVEEAAQTPIKRFYPTAVAKSISLPINIIFDHLLKLVDQQKVALLWEVRCPVCYSTVINSEPLQYGDELICSRGHRFEFSNDIIFPAFEFNPEYRDFLRKNKKKTYRSLLRSMQPV